MTSVSIGLLLSSAGLVCASLLTTPPRGRRKRASFGTPVSRLGSLIRKRTVGQLPSIDVVDNGSIGATVILALMLGVLAPSLVLVPFVAVGAAGIGRTRADRVRRCQAIDRGMVQLIDLLSLAIAGGLPLRYAFAAIAPRLPGEHRVLADVLLDRVQRGESFVAALCWYGEQLGVSGRELVAILVSSERDGSPLAVGLERAAEATRRAQRRDLERRARRLPVTLLLPLVCCVLPAVVVLTLVPLLAGTLGGLEFPT